MRENLFRLAFFCLCLLALAVFGRGVLAETFVSVSVVPKVVAVNPYKRVAFNLVWRIERHPNNRLYSVSYDCGADVSHTERELDGESAARTYERMVELTVTKSCLFQACVIRMVEGRPKTFCDRQIVPARGES
jgi:hypothetical protein